MENRHPGIFEPQIDVQPRGSETTTLPISTVNFHVIKPCNMHCAFCFTPFPDIQSKTLSHGHITLADTLNIVDLLAEAGFRKINFAGGEPFLHPHLPDLVRQAKTKGMVTSIVTNGTILVEQGSTLLESLRSNLDILTVSIDSLNTRTLTKTGRATRRGPITPEEYLAICSHIHDAGIALKINTVVTSANYKEGLGDFIKQLEPIRWKIFQVRGVEGQNSGRIGEFLISEEQFIAYVSRQRLLAPDVTFPIIAETAADMTGTYVMVDPLGRFYNNERLESENNDVHTTMYPSYRYSQPILHVGVATALREVFPNTQNTRERFLQRGGEYTLV